MQRIIAFFVMAGMVSGLIGAFAYDQLGSDAGAAPPPPSATQVREQNLDGSGFIRVHEQGTANVAGTVDVGNLPLDEAGNLRVSRGTGRLALVAANVDVLASTPPVNTSFFNTADCTSITLFLVSPEPHKIAASLVPSMDGIHGAASILGQSEGSGAPGTATNHAVYSFAYYFNAVPAVAPSVAFRFGLATGTEGHIDEAWLYCSP